MTPEEERRTFEAIVERSMVATDRTIRRLDEKLTTQAERVVHVHTFKLPEFGPWAILCMTVGSAAFFVFLGLLLVR